jgi:hypothetical protein
MKASCLAAGSSRNYYSSRKLLQSSVTLEVLGYINNRGSPRIYQATAGSPRIYQAMKLLDSSHADISVNHTLN